MEDFTGKTFDGIKNSADLYDLRLNLKRKKGSLRHNPF